MGERKTLLARVRCVCTAKALCVLCMRTNTRFRIRKFACREASSTLRRISGAGTKEIWPEISPRSLSLSAEVLSVVAFILEIPQRHSLLISPPLSTRFVTDIPPLPPTCGLTLERAKQTLL